MVYGESYIDYYGCVDTDKDGVSDQTDPCPYDSNVNSGVRVKSSAHLSMTTMMMASLTSMIQIMLQVVRMMDWPWIVKFSY